MALTPSKDTSKSLPLGKYNGVSEALTCVLITGVIGLVVFSLIFLFYYRKQKLLDEKRKLPVTVPVELSDIVFNGIGEEISEISSQAEERSHKGGPCKSIPNSPILHDSENKSSILKKGSTFGTKTPQFNWQDATITNDCLEDGQEDRLNSVGLHNNENKSSILKKGSTFGTKTSCLNLTKSESSIVLYNEKPLGEIPEDENTERVSSNDLYGSEFEEDLKGKDSSNSLYGPQQNEEEGVTENAIYAVCAMNSETWTDDCFASYVANNNEHEINEYALPSDIFENNADYEDI